MAKLAEILEFTYPAQNGQGCYDRLDGDDYATLQWNPLYPVPKPTLAEIMQHEAAAAAWVAERTARNKARREFESARPDAILAAFETLLDAIKDVADGKKPKKAFDDLDAQIVAIRAKFP